MAFGQINKRKDHSYTDADTYVHALCLEVICPYQVEALSSKHRHTKEGTESEKVNPLEGKYC